jgi:Protein of unknown function (DUF3151)
MERDAPAGGHPRTPDRPTGGHPRTPDGLLAGPPATLLPDNPAARGALESGTDPAEVAARFPAYPAAWAALAERALRQQEVIAAYAYARTGYHRGLDLLRRTGWRGHGPIPWEHEPNRGFLRSLFLLGKAADAIGEDDEAQRCSVFLAESSRQAAALLADNPADA